MSEIELIETSKERLFEIISDKNLKIMELYQELNKKDEENQELYEELQTLRKCSNGTNDLANEYKKRIDKAKEYIDRRDIEWGSEEHNHVLKILDKGEI